MTRRLELLAHLGIHPGHCLAVDVLPDERLELHAARATPIAGLASGCLRPGVKVPSGRRLGGERFVSFDPCAVQLLEVLGEPAELLQA